MTEYEILSIVCSIVSLVLAALTLGNQLNAKSRKHKKRK